MIDISELIKAIEACDSCTIHYNAEGDRSRTDTCAQHQPSWRQWCAETSQ